ncbi:MAG: hypothetical protein R3E84_05545 [Pseudomonadales bacterium]
MDVSDVLTREVLVPIVGVMTADAEVLPLPPGSAHQTPAPRIVPDPARLAAIRWEPSGRVAAMRGHLYFFVANTNGVDERAWGQRSIIGRANGTQRVGWPKRDGNRVYIEYIERQVEFDVEIAWANPILAVVSPVAWAYQLTDRAPRD